MGRHAVIWPVLITLADMIDYCSRLSSKQCLLPTLNALAAHFSFRFWLFRFRSVTVLDFFVTNLFLFLLTFSFPFSFSLIKSVQIRFCMFLLT